MDIFSLLNGGLVHANWTSILPNIICWKGNIGIFFDGIFKLDSGEVPTEEEVEDIFGMSSEDAYERAYHCISKGLYYENGQLRSFEEDEDDLENPNMDDSVVLPKDMDTEWDKLPKFVSFARI